MPGSLYTDKWFQYQSPDVLGRLLAVIKAAPHKYCILDRETFHGSFDTKEKAVEKREELGRGTIIWL